jgi:hypothetical protein
VKIIYRKQMNMFPIQEAQEVQILFEATMHFTEVTEYGISFQDLLSGKSALPPAGARFDVSFAGTLEGPRLSGTISGTDYLSIRADRRLQLHIHGRVTTPEGTNISYLGEGAGTSKAGSNLTQVRENLALSGPELRLGEHPGRLGHGGYQSYG